MIEEQMSDKDIIKQFRSGNHWGLSTGIDLEKCNMDKISNPEILKEFIIGICDYIGLKQTDSIITKFDKNPKVAGYTAVQLSDDYYITSRFREFDSSAYIDICICKGFEPHAVSTFCKKYFNAQRSNIRYITYRD
jgi:S-adenosylmethionine/arginine decarboxylase-like enzyme